MDILEASLRRSLHVSFFCPPDPARIPKPGPTPDFPEADFGSIEPSQPGHDKSLFLMGRHHDLVNKA